MNNFVLSPGLAQKLETAFRRTGWSSSEVYRLCDGNLLLHVREQIMFDHRSRGGEQTPVIDCDAPPFIPNGWTLEEHQKGGQYRFNAEKTVLWIAEGQKSGRLLGGEQIRKEIRKNNLPVLNANVLDYLLVNPSLIPTEWESNPVFFWGTVYRLPDGDQCVRCLTFAGGERGWQSSFYWLKVGWGCNELAVLTTD